LRKERRRKHLDTERNLLISFPLSPSFSHTHVAFLTYSNYFTS
jgi:hypothetical protein